MIPKSRAAAALRFWRLCRVRAELERVLVGRTFDATLSSLLDRVLALQEEARADFEGAA